MAQFTIDKSCNVVSYVKINHSAEWYALESKLDAYYKQLDDFDEMGIPANSCQYIQTLEKIFQTTEAQRNVR